jgi:hypothetical protein
MYWEIGEKWTTAVFPLGSYKEWPNLFHAQSVRGVKESLVSWQYTGTKFWSSVNTIGGKTDTVCS